MKKVILLFLLLTMLNAADAQSRKADSLNRLLKTTIPDSTRINILIELGRTNFISKPDTVLIIAQQIYELANKINSAKNKAEALNLMANTYRNPGDYAKAIQFYLKSKAVWEGIDNVEGMERETDHIGSAYMDMGDYKKAFLYLFNARNALINYGKSHGLDHEGKILMLIVTNNIAEYFLNVHKIESAQLYLQQCISLNQKIKFDLRNENIDRDLGEVQKARGNKTSALSYYQQAISESKRYDNVEDLSATYLSIANLYDKYMQMDSAIYYGQQALNTATGGGYMQAILNAGKLLTKLFDKENNQAQAYKYFKIAMAAKDSLYKQDKVKQLLSIDFDEKQRKLDIKNAQEKYKDEIRTYLLLTGLVVLLLVSVLIWRNSMQKQRALLTLQMTQTQLIQSEKMASLGELTAGIAHEIQNPLNFVNNFSDVNREMIDELKEELKTGNVVEALAIADSIQQNEQKINHHGKRADGIVKGMLEHSRSSSGQKERTDLNTMADEFMRLSYHGLRSKDKSFNSEMVTTFDKNLPKINVVQQDIGRVLLNLFNNAFYAVNQKLKTADPDYKPEVIVSTSTENGAVIIKVKDNGVGIPDAIKEKIMQPFFTTKPTGQGTGLGLSLSYDIVVKGHSGSLSMVSNVGEGSEFTIAIPVR